MRSFCSVLALAAALTISPAYAQSEEDMAASMEASMAAAQAAAVRPGDEALTCDQLQSEMVLVTQDPAVMAFTQESGAWAQGQMDQAEGARSRAMAGMAGNMAMGIASMFVPGMGYAQMAMQQAQAAQMQSQADQNMAEMTEMMSGMEAIMPQMMRGQRLYELAQTQQCAFLQESAPPTE